MEIRKTPMLSLTLLIIAGVVIGGLFIYNKKIESEIETATVQSLAEVSSQQVFNFNSEMASEMAAIEALAVTVSSMDNDVDLVLSALTKVSEKTSFELISVVGANGKGLTNNGDVIDVSDREYFQRAIEGRTILSKPFYSEFLNKDIVALATPVYKNNEAAAVLFGTYSSNALHRLFLSSFDGRGYDYVVDRGGKIITKTQNVYSITTGNSYFDTLAKSSLIYPQSFKEIETRIHEGRKGHIKYNSEGKIRLAYYAPLQINDWYLFSIVPIDYVSEQLNTISRYTNLLTMAIVAAFAAFIYYTIRTQNSHLKQITAIAFVDKLTGANNYVKFEMLANGLLAKTNERWAFVLLDVDGMKLFNETFGYENGHLLIKYIAQTLDTCLSDQEVFARINSDEFCALMKYSDNDEISRRLYEILNYIDTEFHLRHNDTYNLTFSVGICVVDDPTEDLNSICDKARYVHRNMKQANKNTILFYDDSVKAALTKRKDIENRKEDALKNHEFLVYLQPKYLLADESLAGAEALVRWKTANSFIFPSDFIPVFEQNGFIVKLDMYMFDAVCKIIRSWLDSGKVPVTVSVNFSRVHLNNPTFVEELCSIADSYGVPRHLLEIEITETVMYDNIDILIGVLDRLHFSDFTVSMDDFGTGYSSLGMLKNLTVDVIKMDRTFFVNAQDITRSKTVVSSVMDMAKRLGIHTVAEGVETKEHVDLLRELGCDIVQGYYYAKPMIVEEFEKLV